MKEFKNHTFAICAYKESEYLEECIKSVLNQSYKSNVVIATTTDNKYIRNLAKKYSLEVILGKHTTIGGDGSEDVGSPFGLSNPSRRGLLSRSADRGG